LPKVRDHVVVESSIRDAVGKFDAAFGYAERFDASKGVYEGLSYAKTAPEFFSRDGLLVRAEVAQGQLATALAPAPLAPRDGGVNSPTSGPNDTGPAPKLPSKPHRFYGSVEIDMNRPVKAFDTILNSVVMELQRGPGVKIKLTLEIEAEAPSGFNDADVSVVRDNTKQLKFSLGSTGFTD
jgi:hypothetical protein